MFWSPLLVSLVLAIVLVESPMPPRVRMVQLVPVLALAQRRRVAEEVVSHLDLDWALPWVTLLKVILHSR